MLLPLSPTTQMLKEGQWLDEASESLADLSTLTLPKLRQLITSAPRRSTQQVCRETLSQLETLLDKCEECDRRATAYLNDK